MKLTFLALALIATSAVAQSYTKTGVLPVDPNTLALQDACFALLKPSIGKDQVVAIKMIKGDVEQSVVFDLASTNHKKIVFCNVTKQGMLQLKTLKEAASAANLKKAIAGAENDAEVKRFK